MDAERFEVQRTIAAPASAIFDVLTDPHGHVAIDSSGMLMDATGDPVKAVGDAFVVHMDREALNDFPLGTYDVRVTIVTFERDREIAWVVGTVDRGDFGHVYGYRLEPARKEEGTEEGTEDGSEDGTLVTSYYDWSGISDKWKQTGAFPIIGEATIRATLGILARTVAARMRAG